MNPNSSTVPGAPPHMGLRSFSTSSSASLQSTTSVTSVKRINSGPLSSLQLSMNRTSSAEDHLYYQCLVLKERLAQIPEMSSFLSQAFNQAELCAEQQALALSQQLQNEGIVGINGQIKSDMDNDIRASVGSSGFSIHSDHSASSNTTTSTKYPANKNNIFTFTAGVLPATLSADPVTQIWKLFQEGSPLCLLFNHVYPHKNCHLPVVPSDDLRICKKSVYDFLIAVKTYLKFDDENLFTISNVFSDSTHDLLKIVKSINRVLPATSGDVNLSSSISSLGEIIITDERSKVLKEVIETERKYVQDLELLLQYKDELSSAEIITNEQIHTLFPNLNEIVDFQRRFLIGLECNNNVPTKYQRIGSIFIHAAKGSFKAYEPWTIGQLAAIDLINKEASNLRKSSQLLDPGFELQSYILKPIQRLCKYPLLLKQLIKHSSEMENNASYNELISAERSMRQVANHVNEAQRRAENVGHLTSLQERVSNWRGFNVRDQGELLFHGPISVKDADVEKEYFAYLFERIIFFFVEANTEKVKEKKKNILQTRKKTNSGSSTASSSTSNLLENLSSFKDKTPLELKGRVYISEIYNITSLNQSGYNLIISWSGKKESGSFSLRYRTEENRNQWESCLRNLKAIEMNNQIHRKLRDSNDDSIADYDVSTITSGATTINNSNNSNSNNTSNNNNKINNSNSNNANNGNDSNSHNSYGNGTDSKHHSSSSTFSMMKFSKNKNESSRQSSSGTMSTLSDKLSASLTMNDASFTSTISSLSSTPTSIAVKLFYQNTEIPDYLTVSSVIQFSELRSKISVKISSHVSDDIMINKLKYRDEDGDFVVMDSNDDWHLAVDMLEELHDRILTIWVS